MHISKEKRIKLDERSYQSIHVGYKSTNQYRVYDPQSGQVSITRDVYFDEIYRYNRKDLKPQDFADDEWHKKDDELFADPTDSFAISKPISQLDTTQKIYETYPYFDEFRTSSPFSDIPDLMGDKKHHDKDDVTPEN